MSRTKIKTKRSIWLVFFISCLLAGVFCISQESNAALRDCPGIYSAKCDNEVTVGPGAGYCATHYSSQDGYYSQCVPLRGAICDVSKSPAGTCKPAQHGKFFAGEFDVLGTMRPMYYSHTKDISLGCPADYIEAKVDSGFYDCVKQADCCGGGQGYDEDAKPTCCVKEGETCYHDNTQVGGEVLYGFVTITNLTLYMSPDHPQYSGDGSQKNFQPKTKLTCATHDISGTGQASTDMNTIDFYKCFFMEDLESYGTGDIKEALMSTLYLDGLAASRQTANKNVAGQAIKPLYKCKGGGWTEALKKGFWGFFNSTIGVVVTLVYGIIMAIVVAVLGLLLYFAGAFLEWVIAITQIDLGIVDVVWQYLRDMANMFFILVLLYIAFCVILRIQSKNAKQMLPTFFAAVLLVNFSKLICQVVIDLNQILITTFYNMRPAGVWGLVGFVYRAGGFDKFLGVGNITGKTQFFALISVVGAQSMAAIYMAVSVIVFFAVGILLAIRIVVLWLLTAISPLVYLAWSAGAKSIVRNYWTTFLRTAFFAPAMIFCMVLSVIVMSANIDKVLKSEIGKAGDVLADEVGVKKILGDVGQFQSFMQLIFGLAFMIAGLYAARKGSMIGANAVVGGAEKWMKKGANWATAYKPAKAGLKALGGYGWRKGLESDALGGKLKYFDPKIWKQALERRKKYGEVKARGKRTTELQQKIAGAEAFFFGQGTGYQLAQLQARAGYTGDVNTLTKELDQSDASTEELLDLLVGRLNEMKRKGKLGTESALNAEVEALLNVVLSRGDINDLLKDKGMSELVGNDLVRGGKAVMGADAKMVHRLFGDSGRAVDVANRISEFNKKKYSHMSYMAKYDEEAHERRMAHDTEEMRRAFHAQAGSIDLPVEELQRLFYVAMSHTPQEINDEPLRDREGKVIKELRDREGNVIRDKVTGKPATLYGEIKENLDQVISHLPSVETKGQSGDQERIDKIRGGVTEMLKKYQEARGGEIAAENAKKPARDKLGGHPGNWFQDRNPASMTEAEKEYYEGAITNYLGRTVNTRDNLEKMRMGDAERVRSWAEPRTIDGFKEERNQEMLRSIIAEVRAEGQEKRAQEMSTILEKLFEQVAVTGRGGGGTEGGEGGRGGGGGGATFIADPNAVAKEIAQGRATPPGGGNAGRDRGTEIDEDLNY